MKNVSPGQYPREWGDGSFTENIWAPVPMRSPSFRPSPGLPTQQGWWQPLQLTSCHLPWEVYLFAFKSPCPQL